MPQLEFSSNPKFPVIVTPKLLMETFNPVTATLSVPGAAWIIALIPPIVSPSAEPHCNPSSKSCSNPPKPSFALALANLLR